MTTQINQRLQCKNGLELGSLQAGLPTKSSSADRLLLYVDASGKLNVVDDAGTALSILTEAATEPPVNPLPVATTVYSECNILNPVGTYIGKRFDTQFWSPVIVDGLLNQWYQITYDSCQSNLITTTMTSATIEKTGVYKIDLTFSGNCIDQNNPQVIQIAISNTGTAPTEDNPFTSIAQSEYSGSNAPFSLSGSWTIPLLVGDTVSSFVRVVSGDEPVNIMLYRAQLRLTKI